MTKSKNLFKNISLFLCLVPMLLLSLFCIMPKKQDLNVNAVDTVVSDFSFMGSNIMFPATMVYLSNNNFNRNCFVNLSFSFSLTQGEYSARIKGTVNSYNYLFVQNFNSAYSDITYEDSNRNLPVSEDSAYGLKVQITKNGNITSNIQKVILSSTIDPGNAFNHITYYDTLGNYIRFTFTTWITDEGFSSNFVFQERTYYINLGYLSSNTYYEAGYNDGYSAGVVDGEDVGFKNGYKSGEIVGYGNGYNAGLEYSGNYSFNSLIGAVIDAPVSAFTSLLNFELLGVNILGLITGLLSVAIIVLIVKLCMGGR